MAAEVTPAPDGVTIRAIAPDEFEAARQLLRANGWERRVGSADEFARLLARSPLALVAVEDGRVVGFLRAITDGMTNGYLSMLVVAAPQRERGIALYPTIMPALAPWADKLGVVVPSPLAG